MERENRQSGQGVPFTIPMGLAFTAPPALTSDFELSEDPRDLPTEEVAFQRDMGIPCYFSSCKETPTLAADLIQKATGFMPAKVIKAVKFCRDHGRELAALKDRPDLAVPISKRNQKVMVARRSGNDFLIVGSWDGQEDARVLAVVSGKSNRDAELTAKRFAASPAVYSSMLELREIVRELANDDNDPSLASVLARANEAVGDYQENFCREVKQ
jgi:hypothetical protein